MNLVKLEGMSNLNKILIEKERLIAMILVIANLILSFFSNDKIANSIIGFFAVILMSLIFSYVTLQYALRYKKTSFLPIWIKVYSLIFLISFLYFLMKL